MQLSRLLLRRSVEVMIKIDRAVGGYSVPCVCGQAIGSSLDCLGAIIIGVLGLEAPLRRSDIRSAERALSRVKDTGTAGSKLQVDFREFFEDVSNDTGPEDWLVWDDHYRNMFVHRGR